MERTCKNHPDRPGELFCAKYNRFLCRECAVCQDPTLFCRYRTQCLIHEFEKHGRPDDDTSNAPATGTDDSSPV